MQNKLNPSLCICNFHRCTKDFWLGLTFFLDRSKHNKSNKIGFIFFPSIFYFLDISEAFQYFLCYFNSAENLSKHLGYVHTSCYTRKWAQGLTSGATGPHGRHRARRATSPAVARLGSGSTPTHSRQQGESLGVLLVDGDGREKGRRWAAVLEVGQREGRGSAGG